MKNALRRYHIKMNIRIFLANLCGIVIINFSLVGCQTTAIINGTSAHLQGAAKINVSLGMAYLQRNDIYRAKQKFMLALHEDPSIPETWYAMAYFFELTGNFENANVYYLHALKLAPRRGDVLNNYGTFLCRSGKHQLAIQYFVRAIKDTNYLDTSAAYENAGLCALGMHNETQAIIFLKKAVNEDPKRASSQLELADIYLKQGKIAEANQYLLNFLSLSPPNMRSYQIEQKINSIHDKRKKV